MSLGRALVWAGILWSGGAVAQTANDTVLFHTGGPCYSGILDFAKRHGFKAVQGREVEPSSDEEGEEVVMCTIGPCNATLLLTPRNGRSVEAEIQNYLASDDARRDEKSDRLDKKPDCFAKRTVFEKNAR